MKVGDWGQKESKKQMIKNSPEITEKKFIYICQQKNLGIKYCQPLSSEFP